MVTKHSSIHTHTHAARETVRHTDNTQNVQRRTSKSPSHCIVLLLLLLLLLLIYEIYKRHTTSKIYLLLVRIHKPLKLTKRTKPIKTYTRTRTDTHTHRHIHTSASGGAFNYIMKVLDTGSVALNFIF